MSSLDNWKSTVSCLAASLCRLVTLLRPPSPRPRPHCTPGPLVPAVSERLTASLSTSWSIAPPRDESPHILNWTQVLQDLGGILQSIQSNLPALGILYFYNFRDCLTLEHYELWNLRKSSKDKELTVFWAIVLKEHQTMHKNNEISFVKKKETTKKNSKHKSYKQSSGATVRSNTNIQ